MKKQTFFLFFILVAVFSADISSAQAQAAKCAAQCVSSTTGCKADQTQNKKAVCESGYICCEATQVTAGGGTEASGGTTEAGAVQEVNIEFANPLKFNTVEGVLTSVLSTIQGLVAILAILFIVIGALLYITSGGNEGQIKKAKAAITAALIGMAIAIAAPSFLKEIAGIFGWGEISNSAAAGALTLTEIANSVLKFLLSLIGTLALIMLIIGAIMYLASAGNETRVKTANNIIKSSLIGITLAFAAYILVATVARILTGAV